MAECARCKTETDLYEGSVPICTRCADTHKAGPQPPNTYLHLRTTLLQDVLEATARADAARESFNVVMSDVPSALPHPDGTQRIQNASRELSAARKDAMRAHTRLNDFVSRGIIPENLKQGSGG